MLAVFFKYSNIITCFYWSVCFSNGNSDSLSLCHLNNLSFFQHPDLIGKLSTKTSRGINHHEVTAIKRLKKKNNGRHFPPRRCHYTGSCSVCVDLLATGMWAHPNATFIFIIKALQCHEVTVNAGETTAREHISVPHTATHVHLLQRAPPAANDDVYLSYVFRLMESGTTSTDSISPWLIYFSDLDRRRVVLLCLLSVSQTVLYHNDDVRM